MNVSTITLFDKNIEQISMNRIIEVARFEPEPTFEKTIGRVPDQDGLFALIIWYL